MKIKLLAAVGLVCLFTLATGLLWRASAAPMQGFPTDPNLKIAFIGDTANGANYINVLNLIQAENADAVIHLGDFDYLDDPDGFFGTVQSEFGTYYPYFVAIGNHDLVSWPTTCADPDGCYAQFALNRMMDIGMLLDHPDLNDEMYALTFRGLKIVFTGQTTANGDSVYAPYLDAQLAADDHIWRICAWHKNQNAMQVGTKPDEAGWGVYETCRERGAIIATAHEHSYSRTRTLTSMENQTVDAAWSDANTLRVTSGSTFAFVSGLGGHSIRAQSRCTPTTFPYGCNGEWGSIYTSSQSAQFGALFITFNVDGDPYKAEGYFKNVSGQVIDQFTVTAQPDWAATEDRGVFVDLPTEGKEWMQAWVEQFYTSGLTSGCATDPLQYCPERWVTRAESAVLILRAVHYADLPYTPTDPDDHFADVPVAGKEWMQSWIEEFYDLSITGGCAMSPLRFCPERHVTRAEMAVFLLRALEGAGYTPPAASDFFADVPVSGKAWMEAWIDEIYRRGITTGCATAPLRYCPERPVTRAEMAVFILRAFNDTIPPP